MRPLALRLWHRLGHQELPKHARQGIGVQFTRVNPPRRPECKQLSNNAASAGNRRFAVEAVSRRGNTGGLHTSRCVPRGEKCTICWSRLQASVLAPDLADRGLPYFGGRKAQLSQKVRF